MAAEQIARLRDNCARHNITLHALGSVEQGIVHVIGPQLGLTQPGMTVVCGDSHTSTHGAFGALAFGIGTSEVEHVLATQTLRQVKPAAMAVNVEGELPPGCTAKDLVLGIIRQLGTGGGVGSVIEYRGAAIRALSMEGRMTVCNMSIEGGARAGMIAPDDTTFAFLEGRKYSPAGAEWERALDDWRSLATEPGAEFDHEITVDAVGAAAGGDLGHQPGPVGVHRRRRARPGRLSAARPQRQLAERALTYMDLKPGTAIRDIGIDTVFIGSCTNGRLEDLREAAEVVRGRKIHPGVRALVVPGSARVKAAAEAEGLDKHFTDAGFEWRSAGCSMCLGMNGDILAPGRALGLDEQQELRRQAGTRRAHAPRVARGRRRDSSSRTLQRTRRPVMAGVQQISGRAVALNRRDVDTDQIIPAAWLKLVGRTGFADGLFSAWRADPSFVLNQPGADQAKVLVAGANFGCGSSREHAVWALQDYGFQAVVAPSFADIFRNNCISSGLVPAQVSEEASARLFAALAADPQADVVVDVAARTVADPERGPERAVRAGRLRPVAPAGGPGRHRADPAARHVDRGLRSRAADLARRWEGGRRQVTPRLRLLAGAPPAADACPPACSRTRGPGGRPPYPGARSQARVRALAAARRTDRSPQRHPRPPRSTPPGLARTLRVLGCSGPNTCS